MATIAEGDAPGGSSTARDLSIAYSFGGTREAPRVHGRIPMWYDPTTDSRTLREVLMDRTNTLLSVLCAHFDVSEADAGDPRRLEDMTGALCSATQALFREPSGKCEGVLARGLRLQTEAHLALGDAHALCSLVDSTVSSLQLMQDAYEKLQGCKDDDSLEGSADDTEGTCKDG